MSNFGLRYRGRGGQGSSSRPGLLGAAPGVMKSGLLGSGGRGGIMSPPTTRSSAKFHEPQRFDRDRQGSGPGLLGSIPNQWNKNQSNFGMSQQRRSLQDPDYSFEEEEQYHGQGGFDRGDDYQDSPKGFSASHSLPPEIHRIMSNLGLTKADMEELSRLPQKDLSSGNLLQVIQNIRQKKAAASRSSISSRHDAGPSRQNLREGPHSYGSLDRQQDRDALYDPSEPTDDYVGSERYDEQRHYPEENRQSEAFSSFKEKWYTDSAKSNERNEAQNVGSILRGSRGPVVKTARWESEDMSTMQQSHRLGSQPHRSPPSLGRPTPLMQRRLSPPPGRGPSPLSQRQHSPQRRASPPRRMSPPPRIPSLLSQPTMRVGGLLGDPHDPSTQELDLLAASINQTRRTPVQNVFKQQERKFPEPERFHRRARSISPPPRPLLQQPVAPPPTTSVLHAQMQAMQVLQSEAMGGNQGPANRGPGQRGAKKEKLLNFTKQEAEAAAAKMRKEVGRVLYLRYKAGGMDVVREEHLVKLSQPFGKVTNILLVAPKNLSLGWYQAFLELENHVCAAKMCEQFMKRPPTVQGIAVQVQRSKYKDLKLRQHQMNRDFDKLLNANGGRKRRHRSLSPVTSKKKSQKASSAERSSSSKDKNSKASAKESTDVKSDQKGGKTNGDSTKDTNKTARIDPPSSSKEKDVEKSDGDEKKKEMEVEEDTNDGSTDVKQASAEPKSIDQEKLEILNENIEQASNMCEALLKIVTQKSTKAIISELLEYLSDSLDQLKDISKDSA